MKIDSKTLAGMEQDIRIVINHLNIPVINLNENDLNYIWFITWCNRTYNNDNKNVLKDKNNKRILSFIDRGNYDLYPCNTNDTTIYTGLRQILKNLKVN